MPEYRGANPIASAIIDGKEETGITTMKTVLELDAGDICLQEKIKITPEMNVVELMDKISKLSPSLLDKTLKGLFDNTLITMPQDNTKATFTKKLKKEEKEIIWHDSAQNIHNKIRGMYQINTNQTTYKNKIIKILKTEIIKKDNGTAGEILEISKNGIIVKCEKDALNIITVKPEGKSEMQAFDWANGARIQKGELLG